MPTDSMPLPSRPMLVVTALCAVAGALPLAAQGGATPTSQPSVEAKGEDWIGGNEFGSWAKATGTWGGYRTKLEDAGIEVNGGYTLDWTSVWSGGTKGRATARSLVDVNVTLRTAKLIGFEGGSFYADLYDIVGRNGGTDTGSIYGISNIDGASPIELAELWYEQKLLDSKLRLKVGKIDANSEFALMTLNGDFLHPAGAASPTIVGFPTYPSPATGAVAFVYPSEKCYLGAGFFDGSLVVGVPTGSRGPKTFFDQPDGSGYFWIGEGGW